MCYTLRIYGWVYSSACEMKRKPIFTNAYDVVKNNTTIVTLQGCNAQV